MMRYDADPTYQGYVPLYISANDMLNFGECSGKHVCGQAAPCADHRSLSLSIYLYVYVDIYMYTSISIYVYVYLYMYVYIYIYI